MNTKHAAICTFVCCAAHGHKTIMHIDDKHIRWPHHPWSEPSIDPHASDALIVMQKSRLFLPFFFCANYTFLFCTRCVMEGSKVAG